MSDVEDRSHLCPICEEPNACAMAGARASEGPCWCSQVRIPARLTLRIPEAERGKRCVCARCVERFRRAPTQPDVPSSKP